MVYFSFFYTFGGHWHLHQGQGQGAQHIGITICVQLT